MCVGPLSACNFQVGFCGRPGRTITCSDASTEEAWAFLKTTALSVQGVCSLEGVWGKPVSTLLEEKPCLLVTICSTPPEPLESRCGPANPEAQNNLVTVGSFHLGTLDPDPLNPKP